MRQRTILIDGYNVIRNTVGLAAAERVRLSAGREALIERVRATYRHTPHHVMIVFDGAGPTRTCAPIHRWSRGQVIYSPAGQTADAVLIQLAEELSSDSCEVTVVSNDLDIQMGARDFGSTVSTRDLTSRLNQPSPDVFKRARHRAAVQRQWREDEDHDTAAQRRAGNPRKAKKRRSPPDTAL